MKMPFGDIMKQAQQMQERMQDLQRELEELTVVGESGAGLVRVHMTGRHDVRKIEIDPSLQAEGVEVLGDLVAAAVNDAVRRVESEHRDRVGQLAGGAGLGPFS